MARKYWAGLDVGVETTSICVVNDFGEIIREAVCPTSVKSIHEQIRFLKRRRSAEVAIESGAGMYLARGLRTLGYAIVMYESRQLSGFLRVRRIKTDAGDAFGIAQAGRIGANLVSKVHLKSLECQSLSARLRMRRHLIASRTRAVNLLCRQLEQFGGRVCIPARSPAFAAAVEAELRTLFGRTAPPLAADFRRLLAQCLEMVAQEKALTLELTRVAKSSELCRRFMEIPGVGPICALTFYAAVGEPDRFRKNADIGCYFGLTPKLHQSGLVRRSGRISKMGNKEARTMLIAASTHFMRVNSETRILAWAKQLELRRGRRKSRVALARKLASVMLAMWKKGERYCPHPLESAA